MTDKTLDERLGAREVENPFIVFNPRTRLDDDGAGDAQRLGDGFKLGGEDRAVEKRVILSGKGNALRAGGIVEVGVRIDNAAGAGFFE